tara:strand:+ start:1412 stop:2272 length:861 start_codon:yes stop_codon:yes gene_type:complete
MVTIPDQEYKKFWKLAKNAVGLEHIETISNRIFKLYQERHGNPTPDDVRDHISQIISDCIGLEKENWDNMRNELYRDWISLLISDNNRANSFPTINQLVEDSVDLLNSQSQGFEKIHEINSNLADFNSRLRISLHQSGFVRSGGSLEFHVENCFKILGMKFETQKTVDNQKLDFVFPDKKTIIDAENRGCAVMECQTTLKDRFRLSTARGNHLNLVDKYGITATGAGVVRKNDLNDFSPKKLDEYVGAKMIGVVLKPVAERINRKNIISFEDFVNNEYPRFSRMWN